MYLLSPIIIGNGNKSSPNPCMSSIPALLSLLGDATDQSYLPLDCSLGLQFVPSDWTIRSLELQVVPLNYTMSKYRVLVWIENIKRQCLKKQSPVYITFIDLLKNITTFTTNSQGDFFSIFADDNSINTPRKVDH